MDATNRALFEPGSLVVCLDCDPGELARRLRSGEGRPLLFGNDPEARLRDLLAARQAAYARIAWHVGTTHRSADQVVRSFTC